MQQEQKAIVKEKINQKMFKNIVKVLDREQPYLKIAQTSRG